MSRRAQKKVDHVVKSVEKKYGVDLEYKTDAELHAALKKEGIPSLSNLLKLTQSA